MYDTKNSTTNKIIGDQQKLGEKTLDQSKNRDIQSMEVGAACRKNGDDGTIQTGDEFTLLNEAENQENAVIERDDANEMDIEAHMEMIGAKGMSPDSFEVAIVSCPSVEVVVAGLAEIRAQRIMRVFPARLTDMSYPALQQLLRQESCVQFNAKYDRPPHSTTADWSGTLKFGFDSSIAALKAAQGARGIRANLNIEIGPGPGEVLPLTKDDQQSWLDLLLIVKNIGEMATIEKLATLFRGADIHIRTDKDKKIAAGINGCAYVLFTKKEELEAVIEEAMCKKPTLDGRQLLLVRWRRLNPNKSVPDGMLRLGERRLVLEAMKETRSKIEKYGDKEWLVTREEWLKELERKDNMLRRQIGLTCPSLEQLLHLKSLRIFGDTEKMNILKRLLEPFEMQQKAVEAEKREKERQEAIKAKAEKTKEQQAKQGQEQTKNAGAISTGADKSKDSPAVSKMTPSVNNGSKAANSSAANNSKVTPRTDNSTSASSSAKSTSGVASLNANNKTSPLSNVASGKLDYRNRNQKQGKKHGGGQSRVFSSDKKNEGGNLSSKKPIPLLSLNSGPASYVSPQKRPAGPSILGEPPSRTTPDSGGLYPHPQALLSNALASIRHQEQRPLLSPPTMNPQLLAHQLLQHQTMQRQQLKLGVGGILQLHGREKVQEWQDGRQHSPSMGESLLQFPRQQHERPLDVLQHQQQPPSLMDPLFRGNTGSRDTGYCMVEDQSTHSMDAPPYKQSRFDEDMFDSRRGGGISRGDGILGEYEESNEQYKSMGGYSWGDGSGEMSWAGGAQQDSKPTLKMDKSGDIKPLLGNSRDANFRGDGLQRGSEWGDQSMYQQDDWNNGNVGGNWFSDVGETRGRSIGRMGDDVDAGTRAGGGMKYERTGSEISQSKPDPVSLLLNLSQLLAEKMARDREKDQQKHGGGY